MKPVGNVGPERLEKSVEIGTLYAFYGGLLTRKQQDALRLHYEEDLSLGEIAEELEVSRQNVHELISRSAQKLRKYEQALGGVSRARETAQALRKAQEMLESMHGLSDQDKRTADEAAALIAQVIRRQEGE